MNIPGFDLKYSPEDISWLTKRYESMLQRGFVSMGENVAEFERQYADFCGTKHAIGMATGTCSVEMILKSIDVRNASVLLPSHTFVATATAAVTAGARLIFVDCQPENFQMDPDDLERSIQPDSKVVILVHMAGNISPHLKRIKEICQKHNLLLVEDAAHAHGSTFNGQKAGSLGVAGSFSFFSTKVMTTGEGGMVTTSDDNINRSCRALRDHGRFTKDPNYTEEIGRNARPSEIHALFGLRQMMSINEMLAERRQIARWYDEKIGDRIPFVTRMKVAPEVECAYYKYVLFLDEKLDRQELRKALKEGFGVSLSGELYARPVHSQPVFQKYPQFVANPVTKKFPGTEYAVNRHFCLPLYLGLTEDKIDYIVESLEKAVKTLAK